MKTEILKISTPDDTQAIKKAAKLLDEGALVAFPTETVYGIGCRVDKHSFCRLNEVKARQPDKHYTLHIGSFEQLDKYIPCMSLKARKLAQNALPGPVTIVFQLENEAQEKARKNLPENVFELLYSDGTLGVRYPDCPVTAAILAETQYPIVAPSANPADLAPATTVKEVLSYFDEKIECIVEISGFELDFKRSSTVVKVGKRDVQVLREGVVSGSKIRDWTTLRFLFVCTGNTCRSPMAAGYCRKYFADNLGCTVDDLEGFGYTIDSAGISAYEGNPASLHAIEVCRAENIDLSNHRSRQLTSEDIEQSDVIITMTRHHRDSIVGAYAPASEKCYVLDKDVDILDPIGLDHRAYQNCFEHICDGISRKKEIVL